ncbi:MAG: phosphate signaling complex protein PhoU [Anaerovoracaceae bacterium]
MRSKFDEQLRLLNEEMSQMGILIEVAIQNTIEALFSQNVEKARQIMQEDDLVDQAQKRIEGLCFQLMIQQQPVARDLRNITAAMKMVTDMERIGDHASDIAELTIMMAGRPYPISEESIRKMAAEAVIMLLHSIEAYVERDMEKAQEVIDHDEVVDRLFVKVKGELIQVIREHPDAAEEAADLLMVNKYLERIGDHAVNIAEWVIFSLDNRPESKE